jgi:glucose/arabinose dehydrogenase
MRRLLATFAAGLAVTACSGGPGSPPPPTSFGQLPAPRRAGLIPTVKIAPAKGWPAGAAPLPAPGLAVTAFATGLVHPRWLYILPNGDVLVAESNAPPKPKGGFSLRGWVMGLVMKKAGAGVPSPNRISLLRDADGDGVAETRSTFMSGLASPFGMALVGALAIDAQPTRVVALPAGINHHWTKNILASPDGRRLFVTVGSNSNVAEKGMAIEEGRAAIHELDLATGQLRLFASGLRNPNGLDWEPSSGALWTVVNERDEIGDDLVPDYLTSVRQGAFYGWPYSWWGGHVDERVKPQRPDLVARAIPPDYALGAHTGSLGLAFSKGRFPAPFAEGAFVGQHGSWNRSALTGYKVVFVPFTGGRPSGPPVDVLTGFVDASGDAQGRPVGVAIGKGGALLVADDVGDRVWRVTAKR